MGKPWDIFKLVKRALDEEDIEGLLALGCPNDEYRGEASLIQDRIAKLSDFGQKPLTKTQISRVVSDVWNLKFGPFSEFELKNRQNSFASVTEEIFKQP